MDFEDKTQKVADGMGGSVSITQSDKLAKARGFVSVNKVFADGTRETVFEDSENLVVTMGRRLMSRLLSGAMEDAETGTATTITFTDATHENFPSVEIPIGTALYISKMQWGTGGHDPVAPTEAVEPTPSDEKLALPLGVLEEKTVTVLYPDDMRVTFIATIEQDEANGQPISEVGLFSAEYGIMFSRKTFGMLTKSDLFAFEFQYTIVF